MRVRKTVFTWMIGVVLGTTVLAGCMSVSTPAGQFRPFAGPPAQEAPGQTGTEASSGSLQGRAAAQVQQPETGRAAAGPAASTLQQVRESDTVVGVYERVSPSVVNITFTGRTVDAFGRSSQQGGTGSGFIIDREGHIVTNQHVVANASRLDVTLADGSSYVGQLVVADLATDLAVIKLQAPPEKLRQLTTAPLGDSDQLKVGQGVVAIGNPFGLERSASLGIVSSLGRSRPGIAQRLINNMIQTDAAINPGNSGGPLLNMRGEVVGINEQIEAPARGNVGIGFAIPVNTLKRHLNTMLTGKEPEHSWIGISGAPLTPLVAEQINVSVTQGILLSSVIPNGPAARSGLRGAARNDPASGDVITEIDGRAVRSVEDLAAHIDLKNPNDMVRVTFIRGGRTQTLDVTLGVWQASDVVGR